MALNTMMIIVVGSAPCLHADVEAALKLRPFASLMAINGAGAAIEHIDHLLCGHEEKCSFFIEARKKAFPNAPPIRVHGCTMDHRRAEMAHMFPEVTDWWPFEKGIGATSASKAARKSPNLSRALMKSSFVATHLTTAGTSPARARAYRRIEVA